MQPLSGIVILALLLTGSPIVRAEVRFDQPPDVGDFLQPQARLIHCGKVSAATFSSRTGFIGSGCTPLIQRDTWRVTRCTRIALDEGDIWLVEVRNPDDERRFVPIPWHDWV